jgi:parallel beta-helix repeat protein
MPSITHLLIGMILIASITSSQATVITVGQQGCDFYRIEAAIDSAGPGDIIEVHSGEYSVNLNITTPFLVLRGMDTGEGRPVLRAGSSTADIEERGTGITEMIVKSGGTAIAIREFGCTVEGFDITGVTWPIPYGSGEHNDIIGDAAIRVYSDGNTISNNTFYGSDLTAIGLWNCSNNKIINNTIKDISFGYAVELYNSHGNSIEDNLLLHNDWGIEMQRSDSNTVEDNEITDSINDAIRAVKCNFSIISGNTITGSGWESEYEGNGNGIYLVGSMGLISDNIILFNRGHGIYIESIFWDNYPADESYDNFIYRNKIRDNGKDGIALAKSWQNSLWENNITANQGDGISFTLSHNNTIESNNISKNRHGIFLHQSNYTKIANSTIMDEAKSGIILDQSCTGNALAANIVSNNTEGINVSGGSYGNAIFGNNLTLNVQSVWDGGSNSWDKEGRGNYYGQMDCRDLDGDGICDSPYLIAGGSSVDRYPLASWTRMPE